MDVTKAKEMISDFFTNFCTDIFNTHKRIYNICPMEMARLTDAYTEYMVLKTLAMDTGTADNGGMKLSASVEVDQLWHTHLLFTENYQMFMKYIKIIHPLVDFLHHSPKSSLDFEGAKCGRRQATVTAYKKLFGRECSWMKDDVQSVQDDMNTEGEPCVQDEFKNEEMGPGDDFHILIKDLRGRQTPLNLGSSWQLTTIHEVKNAIQSVFGMPPNQQRLVFAGRQLSDMQTLAYYNVEKHSTLHVIQKLSGC